MDDIPIGSNAANHLKNVEGVGKKGISGVNGKYIDGIVINGLKFRGYIRDGKN